MIPFGAATTNTTSITPTISNDSADEIVTVATCCNVPSNSAPKIGPSQLEVPPISGIIIHEDQDPAPSGAARFAEGILIDQGLADQFLAEQLYPEVFERAAAAAGQPVTLRRHEGYDHGYYFIATFIGEHIAHHARVLCV